MRFLVQEKRADLAASFQRAAVDTLVRRTLKAAGEQQADRLVIAGGVGANKLLRIELANRFDGAVYYPTPRFCTDNGAMIAVAGALRLSEAESPGNIRATARWCIETLVQPPLNE